MKLTEKLLLLISAVVIGAGVFCYVYNRDIYHAVGNMNPATGYAEFVYELSNEEFILSHYEEWSSSNSWVIKDLHLFLTDEDAELDAFSLVFTQAVITFAFYYSFACIPFIILSFVRVCQRRNNEGGTLKDAEYH